MAGDWIKIEKATARKPEVLQLADLLSIHPDHAFGLCVRFWMWADDQMANGHAPTVTNVTLDCAFGHNKFADALLKVGWLRVRSGSLEVPNFERHLSESAKNRALSGNRQRKLRGNVSRNERDESVTRTRDKRTRDVLVIASDVVADADARIEMLAADRGEVVAACNRVIEVVPLGKERKQCKQDRSLVFKAVMLSRNSLSEDWLLDSLEAVKSRKGEIQTTAMRYWWGVLESKCKAMFPDLNFRHQLTRVVVPPDILGATK